MEVLVWLTEATWPACVAAVRAHVPRDAHVTLLHVADDDVAGAARGAMLGLLGRSGGAAAERSSKPLPAPRAGIGELAAAAGRELLEAAAAEVGRDVSVSERHGRVERVVVAAAVEVDLLVLARDGDLRRLGPHSLAPTTRFVVDHAPCATLLVWPGAAPTVESIPPPPDRPR